MSKKSGRTFPDAIAPLLCILAVMSPCHAQTVPPSLPPSPDATLPILHLDAARSKVTLSPDGHSLFTAEGGAVFTWGDLYLTADRIVWDQVAQRIEATGHVFLKRGDESARGDSLLIEGEEGLLTVNNASLQSPPFLVESSQIRRGPNSLVAPNAHLSLNTEGSSELDFRAKEIRFVGSRKIVLEQARIYLFGKRLITVRHIALPVNVSSAGEVTQTQGPPPVTFRYSRISGVVFGLGGTFTLFKGIRAGVAVDQSSKRGIQYNISTNFILVPPRRGDRPRALIPAPFGLDPRLANLSPIRRLITARPPIPPRDPILDYSSILSTTDPLSRPTKAATRDVHLEGYYQGNQEFGARRQGPLILARLPELRLMANVPLSGPIDPDDNDHARRQLRQPRAFLLGGLATGRYVETRLSENNFQTRATRNGGQFGIGLRPLLLGEQTLFSVQAARNLSRYSGTSDHFEYDETQVAIDEILGQRTMIGASYIARQTRGTSPFLFDQVDAQNEAQLRGQVALQNGRIVLGSAARFDAKQGKLFDLEMTVALRRGVLEPRFSYRKLNSQFGFSLGLPGITTP